MKTLLTICLIGAVCLLDQISKGVALALLAPGQILPVFPGFNLTLSFNEGASFGMLSGVMAGRPLLMAAGTGALALIFAGMALRAKTLRERTGLALIVGGASGNIADRLRQGAVTDFIDLYWQDAHWPTFNAADIAICLGALLILTDALRPISSRESAVDRS